MTEEIKTQQIAEDSTKAVPSFREGHTVDMSNGGERTTLALNRYLFENLISNIECQIEYWNRKADCQANPTAGQALRLKAEGLGYALRLLDAFEPEFREQVDCASRAATDRAIQR